MKPMELETPPFPGQRATTALVSGLKAPASAKAVLFGLMQIKGGVLAITLPDGRIVDFGEGQARADMTVRDWRFGRRVLINGDIGFAEGFMAREWETSDLPALLTLLADNIERFTRLMDGNVIGKAVNWLRHVTNANTRAGSRRNILAHYDLGNRFYEAWLDRTMTYSSAKFDAKANDLEGAQVEKYRALAQQLELKAGDHVLEIGCGWGGFAEFAAREYGARVTGITISDEQLAYAQARIERAGLSHLVDIRRQDYRDVEGQFDKVASIEMFEAVGERYWPAYFAKISEVLKPGGRAGLQIITIEDRLFESYRKRADFIQRYVFPGGMLVSIARLKQETANAGLAWRKVEAFGQSYAETLHAWAERFSAKWREISAMGFDERFKKLWLFYLGYCEAGFRTGRTDVIQLALAKPAA
ncbi:SAM-dependent methyltransferase [Terricaulis silvestris]|uniref:Cyclopropane-fatty-acyl-phospholipid synthase n=1 Tax=Terricaulis silvestris TaxID=2686094 RepID=A0A6I6MKB4_9CAUL|nr:cyclopropane-fatty-acyl-phospholipid synthase family protein [Terricaulis silvestris]QGZ95119.1 Cyclopropane-fatty-acyl-phospholipid synthase [Terricaulis silvestris]